MLPDCLSLASSPNISGLLFLNEDDLILIYKYSKVELALTQEKGKEKYTEHRMLTQTWAQIPVPVHSGRPWADTWCIMSPIESVRAVDILGPKSFWLLRKVIHVSG